MIEPVKSLARPQREGEDSPAQARKPGPIRIALFNVKYSPNLGDGLLAECLESEICAQIGNDAHVESIDLAGRMRYVEGRAGRALALSVLHASPLVVRQAASKIVLGSLLSRKLRPLWRAKLRGVDAAIVGGGNLLSDSDLNFPLKLQAAMAAAQEIATPVGVFAVGVSDNWSSQGAQIFGDAFTRSPLFFASVRDERSAEIWRRRLGPLGVAAPSVVNDPGLLVSLHFPASPRPARAKPVVGVGVMHPASLKYHSDQTCPSAAQQTEWMLALVSACVAEGWTVRLFTNGSPEDDGYLKSLAPMLAARNSADAIYVEPRFAKPCDLARFVSGLDLMYAHRLHANIAAYSYGIPQVGFSWDTKLKSFLSQVGRGECLATVGVDPVEQTLQLGKRQLQTGVDRDKHLRVLRQAQADVADLARAVTGLRAVQADGARSGSA